MSHLGRPKEGKSDRASFARAGRARAVASCSARTVPLREDWLDGVDVPRRASSCCCENVRFNKGEKKDDDELARQDGRAVRRVRDGRLRHRASRRGEHARRREVRAGRLRRTAARRASSRRSARRSQARRGRWSRSSPARRSRPSSRCCESLLAQGRPADRRRRHRQHVPRRDRRPRRQVAVRARPSAVREAYSRANSARPRFRCRRTSSSARASRPARRAA